jgi:hypothetical protein
MIRRAAGGPRPHGNVPRARHATLGADKAYDIAEFLGDLREQDVVPHVAQNTSKRSSAIDARTTRHVGYAISRAHQTGLMPTRDQRRRCQ